MTRLTFAVGGLLVATGIIAYLASESNSMTALIPSALGVLLLIAAAVSRAPKARRHAIHAALAVAVLGVAGTAMNVMKLGELFAGTAERPNAVIASTITFGVLLVFLIVGVASFVRARRFRATPDRANTAV